MYNSVCWMVHIKDPMLLIRKSSHVVAAAGSLFYYLNGPLKYVSCHITVNVLSASLNKIFTSSFFDKDILLLGLYFVSPESIKCLENNIPQLLIHTILVLAQQKILYNMSHPNITAEFFPLLDTLGAVCFFETFY